MMTRSKAVSWAVMAGGLAIGGLLAGGGCSKSRTITLDQFVAEQRHLAERPTPTAAAPEAAMISREMGPVRIGPDDVISVSVSSGDAKTILPLSEVRITSAGMAALPLVGNTQLAGLTLQEAEAAVRKAYMPAYMVECLALVRMVEPRFTSVVVLGAVGAPGIVSLQRGNRDILHAIAGAEGPVPAAGGATAAAAPGGVVSLAAVANASGRVTLQRIRQGGRAQLFDLRDPEGLRQALTLDPLDDGDIITVQGAQPNVIFVGGLVMSPSAQAYAPGTRVTVLQALAGAGGLHPYLFPRKGELIHRTAEGRDIHVDLDVKKISEGKAENVELAAGDILWVPHTTRTRILNFFNQIIYFRAGAAADAQVYYSKLYGDAAGTGTTPIFISGTPGGGTVGP
jgi:protein involved in polysaccharide export with SLBB domain